MNRSQIDSFIQSIEQNYYIFIQSTEQNEDIWIKAF